MSPIQAAPNRGYTDWQRLSNMDSGSLYALARGGAGGPDITPVIDVSRYQYLGGYDTVVTAPAVAFFTWYMDALGANGIGQRYMILSHLIAQNAQYRLPNLGPFVRVNWQTIGGVQFGHSVQLIGTNRSHPLELIPNQPRLFDRQNVAVANGGADVVYPGDYYAGPIRIFFETFTASWGLTLEVLGNNGVWDFVTQVIVPIGANNLTWTVPAGAWRLTVSNSSGANGIYYLYVLGSTTGSV